MTTDPLFVRSLDKALRVLEAFGSGAEYLGLNEIAALTGLEKSAVQRCAHTLVLNGYLTKCPQTRRYALGRRCLDLTFNFLHTHPLVEAATPALVELRRACEERVNLSLLDGTTLVYVIRQQGKREYFFSSLVGRRVPVFCTAGGRAIMAKLSPENARHLLEGSNRQPLTARTKTGIDAIEAEVARARELGYGFVDGECTIGEMTVAAAVTGADGAPVAAVHIAGSHSDWAPEVFAQRFGPLALETAVSLSRGQGAQQPRAIG